MKHTISFSRTVTKLDDAPRDGKREICISGRSNVGKSSLINCLASFKKVARVSQTPGKTQALNYYLGDDDFYLVDLPGYGYARAPRTVRERFGKLTDEYLEIREQLVGLIQLFDARHGPVSGDFLMLEWLEAWDREVLYVFTKADKLSTQQRSTIEKQYKGEFGVENMTLFSARTGAGVDVIWKWIHRVVKKI
ncbi:ribosome biogenesis GTP-binding protein YihA/YsxC [Candidatus Latescibacterota bacterium]